MKKIYTLLFLAAFSAMAMAQAITLPGSSVQYRGHDLTTGNYIVQYRSDNGYTVSLTYSSDIETGTFSDEIDTWESAITAPDYNMYYLADVNPGSITVTIDPDGAYHLTGTLHCTDSEFTTTQDFVLSLHRGAPLQPKATVNFAAQNATWSHSFDWDSYAEIATFDATSNGVSMHFAYNAWASFTGEMEPANIMSSTSVSYGGATYAMERFDNGEVVVNNNRTFTFTGAILFKDTVLYNINLTAPIPQHQSEQTLTLTNLVAEENPMSGDLNLKASNNQFDIIIYQQDGVLADGHIEGQGVTAEITDLNSYTTYLAYFVSADLNVSNPNNQTVTADIYSSDEVLYHVTMQYILPDATDTVDITINGAQFINMDNSGQFQMIGSNSQYDAVSLTIQSTWFEPSDSQADVDIKEWLALNKSYVQPVGGEAATFHNGTCSFSRDDNDSVVFSANVLATDAHYYRITLRGHFERRHLEEDCPNGAVNFAFTAADRAEWDIAGALTFYAATFEVTDLAGQHSLALNFYVDPNDLDESDLKIPAGEYQIDNSYMYGSVQASSGKTFDWDLWDYVVTPSLFVQEVGSNSYEYFFLVDGTVSVDYTAEGQLTINVDGLNSYDRPVVVSYVGTPAITGLNTTATETIASKRIENGQVIIRRGEREYTPDGRLRR